MKISFPARIAANVPIWGERQTGAGAGLTLEATAESIVRAALASAGEVAAAIEELAAFTASPETIISGLRIIQAWARR